MTIADRIGVRRGSIDQVEHGTVQSGTVFRRLCAYYNITARWYEFADECDECGAEGWTHVIVRDDERIYLCQSCWKDERGELIAS